MLSTKPSGDARTTTIANGLAIVLCLASCVLAQPPVPVLRGSWTATAGQKQVFRGRWSAQALPATPNSVQGSWVLLTGANQIVLEGTWAADKSERGWRGRWSARVATSRSASGRLLSGTWQGAIDEPQNQTLDEMLQRTLARAISGSWRSSGLVGNWWLKRSP